MGIGITEIKDDPVHLPNGTMRHKTPTSKFKMVAPVFTVPRILQITSLVEDTQSFFFYSP